MSNTGSLGQGGSFDFNSQAGVMAVLAAVRLSQLSPAQKSELRDLVFLYANGGGDATVRRSLEQKIATYGLVPVAQGVKAARASTPAQPVRPYGNTRPSPQFSPVSIISEKSSPTTPVAPKAAAVVPAPVVAPAPTPAPAPLPTPEPVTPPPPPPAPEPEPKPEPVREPVVTPPPAPAPVAAPIPPAPVLQGASTPALDRIREIKSAVNQKVGNPVNLVDIDNAVGREYMMALLEAMKRVSGGAQGDVGQAMARLEAAYSAVEVAISLHNTTEHSAPAVTPAPASAAVASPVPEPTPVAEAAPAPEPVSVPEPVSAPVSADTRWASGADAAPAPMPVAPQPTAFKAASLADDTERLLTPQDLPDAASLATSSVVGDPLFTKEVDAGLEQLLAEWTIFKKSGLFGTGPKGREHPLFKTLAKVTIPLILAGRYDGATQEIRQSVTDYMNGWRYEQGIIYEQEEMFEHYLRRVIRHIIDLQNRQKGA